MKFKNDKQKMFTDINEGKKRIKTITVQSHGRKKTSH